MENYWIVIVIAIMAPMVLAFTSHFLRGKEFRHDRAAADFKSISQALIQKVDVIHTLVDGSKTSGMQSQLDETIRGLAVMRELTELKTSVGREPTVESKAAIEASERKITELRKELADRHRMEATIIEEKTPRGA